MTVTMTTTMSDPMTIAAEVKKWLPGGPGITNSARFGGAGPGGRTLVNTSGSP